MEAEMSLKYEGNNLSATDNSVGYDVGLGGKDAKTSCVKFLTPASGTQTHAMEFATSSGIATQAGGTLTITKKIAIKDDAGNTIYIPAGTIA
jgi:hypothetical protein